MQATRCFRVGASLLANAVYQSPKMLTDTPPSQAGRIVAQSLPQNQSSKRNSGQIGEVPRFCDSRIARHNEHRR